MIKVQKPWWKRSSTAVIGATVAGVLLGITALSQQLLTSTFYEILPSKVVSIKTTAFSAGDACEGESGWVFNKPPNALPVPDLTNPNFNEDLWAQQNAGVPASGYFVQLKLQPVQEQTVIVNSLEVQVVHRSAPRGGTSVDLANCPFHVAITPYIFEANLDSNPVSVKAARLPGVTGIPVPFAA